MGGGKSEDRRKLEIESIDRCRSNRFGFKGEGRDKTHANNPTHCRISSSNNIKAQSTSEAKARQLIINSPNHAADVLLLVPYFVSHHTLCH